MMKRTAVLSWRQVWSIAALALLLMLAGAGTESALAEPKRPDAAQIQRYKQAIENWCADNKGNFYDGGASVTCDMITDCPTKEDKNRRCLLNSNCEIEKVISSGMDGCEHIVDELLPAKEEPGGYPLPSDPRLDPVGGSGQFVDATLSGDGALAPDDAPTAGTTTTGWTVDGAVADERTLALGTDVGHPAHDAEVIPPARAVWTARGRTIDDRTVAEPLRADGTGTVREVTAASEPGDTIAPATGVWAARGRTADDRTVRDHRANETGTVQDTSAANEPDGPRAPVDAEPVVAALAIGEDPINSDLDEFKRFCEHTGGTVERTGDNTWVCRGGWWWGSCDLTPGPEYDCLSPPAPYSTRPGVGTSPSAVEQPLLVSESASDQTDGGAGTKQAVPVDEAGMSEPPVAVSESERQQVAAGGGTILLVAADEEDAADA